MRMIRLLALTLSTLALAGPVLAQDANITMPVAELERMLANDPIKIVSAEISRPKAPGDITLKAEVSFADRPPFRVKLRKSEPGAESFNNVPRYDLAAYEIQRMLMDPHEYVMPPTALRMIPLADFQRYSPDVKPTFKGADEVMGVVQYWLQDIKVIADVYDPARFEADPVYARHIGQLNVFTFLIEHRDSNVGNFLISKAEQGPRVFSIDHGVAFASLDSDRGTAWLEMRVNRLPKDTVERVRALDKDELTSRLGVLGQWELRDGHYVPVPFDREQVAEPRRAHQGRRRADGADPAEISAIARQVRSSGPPGRLSARYRSIEMATFKPLVVCGGDARRRQGGRRTGVTFTALCVVGLSGPVATTATASAAVSAPAQTGQVSFSGVERVVAFADVHGAYEELTGLLKTAGVVDGGLRWSAGRTHLVCTGDMLDRGADSRKVMDLLMRLQGEAQAAGGQVHVTLGNHEAMNLLGNVRDVAPGELEAYAADEPAGVREKARTEWIARNGADSGAKFDARFPVGYFGHRAALAPDGTYGRWLFALPVAIMINDTLFMHGGPSPVLKGLTLSEISLRHRTALTDYLSSAAAVETAGLVLPEDDFGERAKLAEQRLAARTYATPADQAREAEAVRRFVAADANPMIGADGPNWYRGAAMCNACSETDVLKPLLAGLGAKRLVIGHTVTHDARVASRFDGTVIKLDTGMNHAVYRGRASALILEQGAARVIYAGEPQGSGEIAPEELYLSSGTLAESAVGSLLERGEVTVTGPRAPGVLDVAVAADGRRINAVFFATTAGAAQKELAAMKLDRLLGLGLVPATVEREVQGQRGVLQARPAKWTTEADVQARGQRGVGWCALPPQFELMYGFDALIGNQGRSQDRVLYDASEWNLLLTGHDRAFGTQREFPAHLQQRPRSRARSSAGGSRRSTKPRSTAPWAASSTSARSRRCCNGATP